ncbi:hypothetical protein NPX13_g3411 [Xylaria arbuscula]|uniref:Uncharacterized protein n=1 Tax=Xylaria arbuscula TaxID=114810 RepID=A0A9W8NHT8_9PEZI|nr:hypothetical protein NPX13_g3411 [Xylaria arbuscula]
MLKKYFGSLFNHFNMAGLFFKEKKMKRFSSVQITELEDKVVGFDENVVKIAQIARDHQEARQLLEAQFQDRKIFQIGVRISNHHASVIIHEPESGSSKIPTTENPVVLSDPVELREEYHISSKGVYVALVSAPEKHSIVIDDCATFTSDFSKELLKSSLTEDEIKKHMGQLEKIIVIVDESARAEASSRRVAATRTIQG